MVFYSFSVELNYELERVVCDALVFQEFQVSLESIKDLSVGFNTEIKQVRLAADED